MTGQTENKSIEDRFKAPNSGGAKRWFAISLLPVSAEGFMCIFLLYEIQAVLCGTLSEGEC